MTGVAVVLELTGTVATVVGAWRSYAMAREAVAPFAHEGDPTRTAIEAAQPIPMRPRVRLFARRVSMSIAWLVVALYGLYLVATGMGGPS